MAVTVRCYMGQDGKVHMHDEDAIKYARDLAAQKWPAHTMLLSRLEPEEEAISYYDMKCYFAQLIGPFCAYTGYARHEAHVDFKTLFMPEGKTSLTQLSHDEFRAYYEDVERYIRDHVPEVFESDAPPRAKAPRRITERTSR